MRAKWLQLVVMDAIMLILFYLVAVNLQAREAYASSEGFSVSYLYSVAIRSLQLAGRGVALRSPATLDFLQVLPLLLLLLNGAAVVSWFRRRKAAPSEAKAEA